MKSKRLLAAGLLVLTTMGIASCSSSGGVDETGTTSITFWYPTGNTLMPKMKALVDEYNNTQGKIDKVRVVGAPNTSNGSNHYQSCAPTAPTRAGADLVWLSDRYIFNNISQDLYVNLTEEYFENPEKQDLITKDENGEPLLQLDDIAAGNTDRFKFDKTNKIGGEGEDLYAIMSGVDISIIYYNQSKLQEGNVNEISVSEDELEAYNKEHGTNFAARGYAEYKVGYLTGDASNFKTSKNLDGEEVVKVFNNKIPLSFKELYTISKNFSTAWNSASPTTFGIANEWRFSHGWAVGGDCAAYDNDLEKQMFTLGDRNPSYMVTKDVTIGEYSYKAGDLVTYNTRKDLANDSSLLSANADSLHELPSQYDQFREFVAMSHTKGRAVDTYNEGGRSQGMQIAPDPATFQNNGKINYFASQNCLMIVDGNGSIESLNSATNNGRTFDYDVAPLYTYREFEGEGNDSSVPIRVIGEKYNSEGEIDPNGTLFEGKLVSENGTEIKVAPSGSGDCQGYAIPANSKYKDASFKFLQWLCSEKGQSFTADGYNNIPSDISLSYSDEFINYPATSGDQNVGNIENYWALAYQAENTYMGDWSYFENGAWINEWSGILNSEVRGGTMTLDTFFSRVNSATQTQLDKIQFRFHGKE